MYQRMFEVLLCANPVYKRSEQMIPKVPISTNIIECMKTEIFKKIISTHESEICLTSYSLLVSFDTEVFKCPKTNSVRLKENLTKLSKRQIMAIILSTVPIVFAKLSHCVLFEQEMKRE